MARIDNAFRYFTPKGKKIEENDSKKTLGLSRDDMGITMGCGSEADYPPEQGPGGSC